MSGSTNIMDLPTDPTGGGMNNISLSASENMNSQASKGPVSLDQTTINQIVNGLQQATVSGATQLPSRDIPMNTVVLSTDPQIQPNYIPQQENSVDYINNVEHTNDMINDYNKNTRQSDSLDDMYNELQTPFLLTVLYFMFQLPFFRKLLYKYLPVLFSNDGNLSINGLVFNSALFGLLFYVLNKTTQHFSRF